MRKLNHVLKSKIGMLSLLLSLAFVVGCSKEEDGMGATLSGIISDSQTGKQLAGAKVELEPLGKEWRTGTFGSYEFDNLPTGNYTLVVSKENYHTERKEINLSDAEKYTLDIALVPPFSDFSVLPLSIDLGYDLNTASVDIVNTGDFPIDWEISSIGTTRAIYVDSIKSLISCVPMYGRVEVGAIQTITLNVGRNMLYSGKYEYMIHFAFNEGKSVDVNVTFSIPPYTGEEPNSSETVRTFVIDKATSNEATFNMVRVEAGTFIMGATSEQTGVDSDEKPAHTVTLTKDYYIGETEVTQELYEAVMGSNPSSDMALPRPVNMVTWNDCQTFIEKLNSLTGLTFRLPTEAEWEYAARGGNKSKGYIYSGSNTIDDVAWFADNTGKIGAMPVGTKKPNELGIYDMSGNVWEWCQDWYGSYSSGSQTDPTGSAFGSERVARGGNWYHEAKYSRVVNREGFEPSGGGNLLGFRLALSDSSR